MYAVGGIQNQQAALEVGPRAGNQARDPVAQEHVNSINYDFIEEGPYEGLASFVHPDDRLSPAEINRYNHMVCFKAQDLTIVEGHPMRRACKLPGFLFSGGATLENRVPNQDTHQPSPTCSGWIEAPKEPAKISLSDQVQLRLKESEDIDATNLEELITALVKKGEGEELEVAFPKESGVHVGYSSFFAPLLGGRFDSSVKYSPYFDAVHNYSKPTDRFLIVNFASDGSHFSWSCKHLSQLCSYVNSEDRDYSFSAQEERESPMHTVIVLLKGDGKEQERGEEYNPRRIRVRGLGRPTPTTFDPNTGYALGAAVYLVQNPVALDIGKEQGYHRPFELFPALYAQLRERFESAKTTAESL